MPNTSVKLTPYGSPHLVAPGTSGIIPFAAKYRLPLRPSFLGY